MGMFDNYPQPTDYIPNNIFKAHRHFCLNIMTGESTTHTFEIPFDVSKETLDVEIIYKLGLNVVLTKPNEEIEVLKKDKCNFSYVSCKLTPEETLLFKDTLLDTHVQLKFTMKDGTTMYSEIYKVNVKDSLPIGGE